MSVSKTQERIDQVKQNIAEACSRVNRDPEEVKLVVVTKSVAVERIQEVIQTGCIDLGENRAQRLTKVCGQIDEWLQEDRNRAPEGINWHMIGHLQRNKVKHVLPIATMIHSVDSLRLAEEINKVADKQRLEPRVLLQVNTSQEPQKYGVPVGAANHLAEQIQYMENISLCGLMTMAPLTRDTEIIRSCFVRARELFVEMRGEGVVGSEFKELSMGMSSDYQIAVEQGATIVRIGSAIFA